MTSLFWRAYFHLVRFEFLLAAGNFARLYQSVREHPLGVRHRSSDVVERICSTVDSACVWYPKQVLCLQRSAATACLLKKYGVAAELVIGAQLLPFRAHAWVETDSSVVNDKPYVKDIYTVLDRC